MDGYPPPFSNQVKGYRPETGVTLNQTKAS